MLAGVSEQQVYCYLKAEDCERKSKDPSYDAMTRRDYALLAASWMRLAHSYDCAAKVSAYLEWQARRLKPPPGFSQFSHESAE